MSECGDREVYIGFRFFVVLRSGKLGCSPVAYVLNKLLKILDAQNYQNAETRFLGT